MKKFWCAFFIFWPIVAVVTCLMAPGRNWWFPSESYSVLGRQIDDLFNLILIITTVTFIGTQIALGYVLIKGAGKEEGEKGWYSHGSHNLEMIWSIVPAAILLFIALYQMDVWADFSVQTKAPEDTELIAEVTARQFEWRMRYPKPGTKLQLKPQPGDMHIPNELHVPTNRTVKINLLSADVQHSFFVPALRVKKDAVPNLVIPIWFEVTKPGEYELVCAELCGWGHYKMKAKVVAHSEKNYQAWLKKLHASQTDDGFEDTEAEKAAKEAADDE